MEILSNFVILYEIYCFIRSFTYNDNCPNCKSFRKNWFYRSKAETPRAIQTTAPFYN